MTTKTTTARSFDVKHKNPVVKSAYFLVNSDGSIKEGPKHLIERSIYNSSTNNFEFFFKDNFQVFLSATVQAQVDLGAPIFYAWNNVGSGFFLAISAGSTLVPAEFAVQFVFQDSTLPSKD